MNYLKLDTEIWKGLSESNNLIAGYKCCWLSLTDEDESKLYIFKDICGQFHFAIEAVGIRKIDIEDPQVNGLHLQIASYRLEDGKVSQFIDLMCIIPEYLKEFTEIVRQISKSVLEDGSPPLNAVNQIINNWISFWTNQRKEVLSEEDQLGLICELLILKKLCKINAGNVLKTWTGPLGEKHDFNFTDWNFEVKGTRKSQRTHTINGIDQLKPSYNKHLGFISFQLTFSVNDHSINLPGLIESLTKINFEKRPDLIVRFNELLSAAGYSPIYAEEYKKFKVEVLESAFFEVDDAFPRLTSSMLNSPLDTRVSSVRYDISLDGLTGKDLDELNWGEYYY